MNHSVEEEIGWAELFVAEGARQVAAQLRLISLLHANDKDFHVETQVLRTLEKMQVANLAYREELKRSIEWLARHLPRETEAPLQLLSGTFYGDAGRNLNSD